MEQEESSYLSGLFQQIVEDCKTELPLFDEFISKSLKLQIQLASTVTVFGSFLDTAQKITDRAAESKGSSTDIGICLEMIVSRHRVMEVHMKTLTSSLSDCLTVPLQTRLENWRKKVGQLDREHTKQFKKMKEVVKKKSQAVVKIEKKVKKRNKDSELADQMERSLRDLQGAKEIFIEKERTAVRDIQSVERAVFATFAGGWKQVIAQEFAMLSEVEKLGPVVEKIDKEILFPCNMLEYGQGHTTNMDRSFYSHTATSSPYGAKSRSESCKSHNSYNEPFSSRHSSIDSQIDDRTSSRSWNNTLALEQNCSREENERQRLSVYHQENQDFWLSYQEGSEEVLKVTTSPLQTILPAPSPSASDSYRPSLPQRGCVSEPHYSVPQNNSRVKTVGQEVDKTPTNETELLVEQVDKPDISGSESCSSGYSSNDVQQTVL